MTIYTFILHFPHRRQQGNERIIYIYIDDGILKHIDNYRLDMSTVDINDINILDLPDEILLAIINKLNMIDILYSLVDVNQRFDRLVLDPLYIHHLDLMS